MVFYPWTWRWNKGQAYPSRTRLPPLAESPLPEIQGISEGIMKWYGTWNNGWYMECLTLIFHVFPGSQIAVERVKAVARCADCLLKSQNIFQPGRHACCIPQTALPSWQPRSLRKISTAKVVGVSLCTWDLRHVRRRCQRAGNHLGGQTSFISDSLRYLISPKLKQMKKHPKASISCSWAKVIQMVYSYQKPTCWDCPPIGGCVGTSVWRVSKASVATSSLTTCLRQLRHTPLEMDMLSGHSTSKMV